MPNILVAGGGLIDKPSPGLGRNFFCLVRQGLAYLERTRSFVIIIKFGSTFHQTRIEQNLPWLCPDYFLVGAVSLLAQRPPFALPRQL
jgi:hypothetical protein